MEDRTWHSTDADERLQCDACEATEDLHLTIDLDTLCARCCQELHQEVRKYIG